MEVGGVEGVAIDRETLVDRAVEFGTACTAVVTPPGQPRIVPLSVAKTNFEDTFAVPLETWKFGPPLNTVPVGASGTLTTSGLAIGNGCPSPS